MWWIEKNRRHTTAQKSTAPARREQPSVEASLIPKPGQISPQTPQAEGSGHSPDAFILNQSESLELHEVGICQAGDLATAGTAGAWYRTGRSIAVAVRRRRSRQALASILECKPKSGEFGDDSSSSANP